MANHDELNKVDVLQQLDKTFLRLVEDYEKIYNRVFQYNHNELLQIQESAKQMTETDI